jgi:hypothetical protein
MNEMWCATRYAVCVWPIGLEMQVTQSVNTAWQDINKNTARVHRALRSAVWKTPVHQRRLHLKCDGTSAETRFRLTAKRTSPFKSVGASFQSTTGSRGVRIGGCNAGCTMFRGSVKNTGYTIHSPVSPSLQPSCDAVCHHIPTGLYRTHKQHDLNMFRKLERPGGNLSTSPVRCSNSLTEMQSLTSAACRQSNMKPRIRLWQVVCRWYIPEGLVLQRQTCSVHTGRLNKSGVQFNFGILHSVPLDL